MIRVAIYARVSTDFDDSLKSLENQVLACIDLVENNPEWQLEGIYSDRGISGTSIKHRRSFQRLLRHCEEHKIDLIITKSISRFSRNTHDFLGVLRRLRQLHVDVIFEKEGIRLSEADNEFMLTLYAAITQQEVVNTSQNISWAYRRRALAGIPKFRRLYGYRVVGSGQNQMLEPIPEEAEVVREIFEMYSSGSTISDIIRHLASAGIQTIKGQNVWSKNNIKRLLRNIKYTGNSRVVKQASRLSELQMNPSKEDEAILINNSHPALIDPTLFDAVQMIIDANHASRTFNPQSKENILVGRIHCAHCAANYVLFKRLNKDTIHVCATRRKNKESCASSYIKASQLLQLMKQAIGARYTMDDQSKIECLRSDLIASSKLDQIEKERLDRIITIARLTQQIQMTSNHVDLVDRRNELEHSFQKFEQDLESAENDLPIRMNLINKLSKTHSVESFLKAFTTEDGCALFPSIKLYTSNDAILTWHDHHETIIGQCPSSVSSIPPSFHETKEINNTGNISKVVIPWNNKAVIAQSKLYAGQLLSSMNTGSGPKLRVCAYCRTSAAEEQHISSLSRQVASYTHVIMTNPAYTFAGIYTDHGKSGLNITKRSGFQQMIDDARSGQFDLIITKSVSRFGRNVVDVLATVRELKSLPKPVLVLFENESLRSDLPQCDFMLSLHAAIAQNEAYSSSESIRWSHIKSLKDGSYNQSGKLPYGYFKTSNNQWMINELEATIIRHIFDAYIAGKTPYTIASDLTHDQILNSRGGKQWRPATIYRMIHNITYIGHFLHGRLFRPDLTRTRRITNQGQVDQYLIEHHHPPIIDLDTWNQAQAISISRKRTRSNRKKQKNHNDNDIHRQTLIKQRVRCGKCGKTMFHRSVPYKQHSYPYCKCIASVKSIQHDRCDLKAVRQEIIEHAIMTCLLRMKHNDDWQGSMQLYYDQIKQNNDTDASLEQLKAQETKLYNQIYACVETEQEQSLHMIDQITSFTEQLLMTKSRINELEHNKKIAEAELSYLSNLTNILNRIPDFDSETERIEFNDDIFEKLFKSIEIFNNSTIRCNLVFDYSKTIVLNETNLHKLKVRQIT